MFFNSALVVREGIAQKESIPRLCDLRFFPFHLRDMEASGSALQPHMCSLSLRTWPSLGIGASQGLGSGLGLAEKSGSWVSCSASTMLFTSG